MKVQFCWIYKLLLLYSLIPSVSEVSAGDRSNKKHIQHCICFNVVTLFKYKNEMTIKTFLILHFPIINKL